MRRHESDGPNFKELRYTIFQSIFFSQSMPIRSLVGKTDRKRWTWLLICPDGLIKLVFQSWILPGTKPTQAWLSLSRDFYWAQLINTLNPRLGYRITTRTFIQNVEIKWFFRFKWHIPLWVKPSSSNNIETHWINGDQEKSKRRNPGFYCTVLPQLVLPPK